MTALDQARSMFIDAVEARRQNRTADALTRAREAICGFAAVIASASSRLTKETDYNTILELNRVITDGARAINDVSDFIKDIDSGKAAVREFKEFVCPKCGGTYFASAKDNDTSPLRRFCTGGLDKDGCGFSWLQSDDDKYLKVRS